MKFKNINISYYLFYTIWNYLILNSSLILNKLWSCETESVQMIFFTGLKCALAFLIMNVMFFWFLETSPTLPNIEVTESRKILLPVLVK